MVKRRIRRFIHPLQMFKRGAIEITAPLSTHLREILFRVDVTPRKQT